MSKSATLSALIIWLRSSCSFRFSSNLNFEFIVSKTGIIHGLNSFVNIVSIVENLNNSIFYNKSVISNNPDFLHLSAGRKEFFKFLLSSTAAEALDIDLKLSHKIIWMTES